MLIRFKNKMTAAIISMIEKGKSHGGLPSCIEISVDEAQSIINEINSLRNELGTQHGYYKITRNGVDARLSLTAKDLTDAERFQFLTEMTEGKIKLVFDGVPLNIVIVADKDKAYHD